MDDLIGLIGIIGADADTATPCTADLSAFGFGMQQVARAAANVYREGRARVGFTDSGGWFNAGLCLPFQHVERIVPDAVIDGMLIPGRTTHLFRFHSSAQIEAGDALWMRVGNYPGSVWLVDGAGAKTTWMANVLEVEVSRLYEAETALVTAIAA
jgi:hypothetical protein